MSNHLNIDLKVCGITTSASITTAANNNIKSLGFASDNLLGPNTVSYTHLTLPTSDLV